MATTTRRDRLITFRMNLDELRGVRHVRKRGENRSDTLRRVVAAGLRVMVPNGLPAKTARKKAQAGQPVPVE